MVHVFAVISKSYKHYHHHYQGGLTARIPLILSCHPFLSAIALGKFFSPMMVHVLVLVHNHRLLVCGEFPVSHYHNMRVIE